MTVTETTGTSNAPTFTLQEAIMQDNSNKGEKRTQRIVEEITAKIFSSIRKDIVTQTKKNIVLSRINSRRNTHSNQLEKN